MLSSGASDLGCRPAKEKTIIGHAYAAEMPKADRTFQIRDEHLPADYLQGGPEKHEQCTLTSFIDWYDESGMLLLLVQWRYVDLLCFSLPFVVRRGLHDARQGRFAGVSCRMPSR